MEKASLVEVFTSLQGEGSMMGLRQIFVRFAGCNLECLYCDTDFSLKEKFRLETRPFSKKYSFLPNPVDAENLLKLIIDLRKKALTDWLVLSGGEPLLQANFLAHFLPQAKKKGFKIFLETNATLPEGFLKLKKYFDFVSLDLKLPDFCRPETALRNQFNFFRLCSRLEGEAKVVIVDFELFSKKLGSPGTNLKSLIENFNQRLVEFNSILPHYPLVLQPSTVFFEPSFKMMLKCQRIALKCHSNVKLLPRLQVLYNLL